MDNTYNGYRNYETWCLKLWIDNDYGSYCFYRDITKESKSIYDLSIVIKENIEECTPVTTGFFADIMGAALRRVDWYEIAECLWDEHGMNEAESGAA